MFVENTTYPVLFLKMFTVSVSAWKQNIIIRMKRMRQGNLNKMVVSFIGIEFHIRTYECCTCAVLLMYTWMEWVGGKEWIFFWSLLTFPIITSVPSSCTPSSLLSPFGSLSARNNIQSYILLKTTIFKFISCERL